MSSRSDQQPVTVPGSFEDITVEWLNQALAEGGVVDAAVDSIRIELMDPSKGLIGDLASVYPTYADGSGPEAFAIKLPAASADSRRIGDMLNAYLREVAFYRHVAPQSPDIRVPRCFYAGEDLASGRWAIVLEFIEADEFDVFAGADPGQAAAAIDALADFHAVWWNAETRFEWMPGFDSTGVGGLQPLWLKSLPSFVDRYRGVLPGATAEWVLRFAPQLTEWSARAAQEPLTMVHSDYRIDNLLFQGADVTMIDWQTAMRAPAAMDLSCFITTSLDVEVRRRDEDSYIDRYLQRLEHNGVEVDRDWFLRSYDENILWWMGQFGNNLAYLDPPSETVAAALTQMIERVYTAGMDRYVDRLI